MSIALILGDGMIWAQTDAPIRDAASLHADQPGPGAAALGRHLSPDVGAITGSQVLVLGTRKLWVSLVGIENGGPHANSPWKGDVGQAAGRENQLPPAFR